MATTGLFLISFLVIHVGINACIFYDLPFADPNDNGSMFNRAAHFMGSSWVIRAMEFVLFAGFLVHIIQGWMLEAQNRRRRQQDYAVNLGNRGSKWYSRSMGLLGTLIFLFLVLHIAHFWVPSRITHDLQPASYPERGVQTHDLFFKMQETFQGHPIIVGIYVLGCLSLAYHLMHGFHSSFRTMGVHNKKYLNLLKTVGYGFAIIVPLIFALMPISMYFGWVGR